MPYQMHPNSLVETKNIGEGTRIWAFVHILPGAKIGSDCNLCDHVFIENDVIIGDRVTIKSGVQIWDGIQIDDDVFIGPNVTFTNDPFPRSKHYSDNYSRTVVRKGASIGANATILPGIEIGRKAMVGAGAVVTKSIPPNAIVVGNPARIVNYVGIDQNNIQPGPTKSEEVIELPVKGVKLINLPKVTDIRGNLTFSEFPGILPFSICRYFIIFDVPSKHVRGEHAHKELHELLVCVHGNCAVIVDDGKIRSEVILDDPTLGLYVPPMIWATQYKFSSDAVLLALASDIYKADDYIRDYEDFLELVAQYEE